MPVSWQKRLVDEARQHRARQAVGDSNVRSKANAAFPSAEFIFTLGIGSLLIFGYASATYDQLRWYHRGRYGEYLDVPLDSFLLAIWMPVWVAVIAVLVAIRARRRTLAASATIVSGGICWFTLAAAGGFDAAWFGYIERCQSQPEERFIKLIAWADKIRPDLDERVGYPSRENYEKMPEDVRIFCYDTFPAIRKSSRNQAVVIRGQVFWEAMVQLEVLPEPVTADFQFDHTGGRFQVHPQVVVVRR